MYLASVYTLPPKVPRESESLIFKFLWGDRGVEPIKREYLYLPIAQGGLGILHPHRQVSALQLKFLKYALHQSAGASWTYYAKYWLARRAPKHNPKWAYLRDNTCAKYNGTAPPPHYGDTEHLYAHHKTELNKRECFSTKEIYGILSKSLHLTIPAANIWQIAPYLRHWQAARYPFPALS